MRLLKEIPANRRSMFVTLWDIPLLNLWIASLREDGSLDDDDVPMDGRQSGLSSDHIFVCCAMTVRLQEQSSKCGRSVDTG